MSGTASPTNDPCRSLCLYRKGCAWSWGGAILDNSDHCRSLTIKTYLAARSSPANSHCSSLPFPLRTPQNPVQQQPCRTLRTVRCKAENRYTIWNKAPRCSQAELENVPSLVRLRHIVRPGGSHRGRLDVLPAGWWTAYTYYMVQVPPSEGRLEGTFDLSNLVAKAIVRGKANQSHTEATSVSKIKYPPLEGSPRCESIISASAVEVCHLTKSSTISLLTTTFATLGFFFCTCTPYPR